MVTIFIWQKDEDNKRSSKVSHLASTASTALFADAAQINDFQFPASPTRPLLEEFYYISDGPSLYANGHFRHQKRVCFLL